MTETTLHALRVDRRGELPVGTQIVWQLRALIASGSLPPGERLPGVRDLARLAGIDPNTARSVYARLESESLIESRQGRGTFVAEGAAGSADVDRIASEAIAAARQAGVSAHDVARALFVAGEDAGEPHAAEILDEVGAAADEAAARRELRRQIAKLEAELAAYPATRSDDETHPLLRPKGRVAGFEELSAIRDQLIELLRTARSEAARADARRARARARSSR